jgi:hypothetical protein
MSHIGFRLALLLIVVTATQSARASIQIQAGDYIRMTDGLGGRGGVFNTQETNSTTSQYFGDIFPTFCVEVSENVVVPGTYFVQSLSSTASNSGNILTDLAGWIYADFLDAVLPSQPAPTATNATKTKFNNSVQIAIWYELLNHAVPKATLAATYITGGPSNYDLVLVDTILASVASAHSGSGHGVQIMNLRSSNAPSAAYIQDQLVRNSPVPEVASLIMWTLLISCAGTYSARRRDNSPV